jgi:hypothetical protein
MSPSSLQTVPSAWRFALIGALASLPLAAGINRLPNSEATLGGGVMILGAFIAGAIAAIRTTDPDAAGLRAGFLGGILAVLTLIVTVLSTPASSTTAAWPLSRVVFWVFAVGLALCLAPVFGLACGRIGGWVANSVTSRYQTGSNAS